MMTPIERSSYDVVMTACDLLADLSVERETMSFSQEGLLTDLSAGFQTFLTWVKRKVQELIHKFLIFIRDMKDAYLQVGEEKHIKSMLATSPVSEMIQCTRLRSSKPSPSGEGS